MSEVEPVKKPDDAPARCLVYCRMRPDNKIDYEDGGTKLLTLKGKTVAVEDERTYTFDGSFDQDSKQEDVFDGVAAPCLSHAFKGFCSALMCYGQTGTGKSFTMCCTKPGIEGIIPRSAQYLFDHSNRDPKRKYTISGQFVQIYRDQLGDLMTEDGKGKCDIRFDKADGVTLPGCSSHELNSAEEFMKFYDEGNVKRIVTATAMNPESSRGHTALIIWVESRGDDDSTIRGKCTFIDLAGYERFSKTGISGGNVVMKDEAKTINASLLSLGHVVTSLSNGDKHVPWRNAKLTRLLQDSIGGRSRTTIILTVGPSSESLHETTNSLQFGMRAMAVKVEAKITAHVDYEKLSAKLQSMLDEKDKKIDNLEIQAEASNAERGAMLERQRRDEEQLRSRHEEEIDRLTKEGASGDRIVKATHLQAVESQGLQEEQREEVQYLEEAANREMVAAISEQSRKQQMRAKEMELAQDRLVKDFERKLEEARDGGNGDMLKLMQQLADRDSALVSRAQQVAELDNRVSQLCDQIKDAGLDIEEEEEGEKTYLDFVQVEEMRKRYETDIEAKKFNLLEATTQLDKVEGLCRERGGEIDRLTTAHGHLVSELEAAGVSIQSAESELNTVRTGMVDQVEVEHMKFDLQSQIDHLTRTRDSLNSDLEETKTKLKAAEAKPFKQRPRENSILISEPSSMASMKVPGLNFDNLGGQTPRQTPRFTLATPRGFPQTGSSQTDLTSPGRGGTGGGATPGSATRHVDPMEGGNNGSFGGGMAAIVATAHTANNSLLLKQQIVSLNEEVAQLTGRNHTLCSMLSENQIEVPQPATSNAADGAAASGGEVAEGSAKTHDIRQIFNAQDEEATEAYALVTQLEVALKASEDRKRQAELYNKKLQREIISLSGKVPTEPTHTAPEASYPVEQFEKVLETLRMQNRELQANALARGEWIRSDDTLRNAVEPGKLPAEDEIKKALGEKDTQIADLQQQLITEKSTVHHIGNLFAFLTSQIIDLGAEPMCVLPKDVQSAVDSEAAVKDSERQQRLGEMAALKAEQRNKEEKLKGMLASVGSERAKDASVFESYQAGIEAELEEQRAKADALEKQKQDAEEQLIEAKKIRFLALEKQTELDEALAENTRQLMAAQANDASIAAEEAESGFFKRLFKKK